jgi:hypothetical protein
MKASPFVLEGEDSPSIAAFEVDSSAKRTQFAASITAKARKTAHDVFLEADKVTARADRPNSAAGAVSPVLGRCNASARTMD